MRWTRRKRLRTRIRELLALGLPFDRAFQLGAASKGTRRMAGIPLSSALPNSYWHDESQRPRGDPRSAGVGDGANPR